MNNTITYNTLRKDYEYILNAVTVIASDFEKLLQEVNEENFINKNGYSPKTFQILRERADSELLSLAFFGAFSSGKSFLISGLNSRIEIFKHEGRMQYAPLLPASPRHTSSCPVAVEPLPPHYKNDNFFVNFDGSEDWEQKTPAKLAIIQAYVTDLPNAKAQRLTNKDRTRAVVKAKLEIASAIMKARLYDLPGFGAIGVNYEKVIHGFVQQADCIVYIAWAVRPLDEKDLELLRDIYNHHKITGKPVFFVLTQIDLSWDIDASSGKVKWEDVLEANNEFLSTHFITKEGQPDSEFIGGGFIPVSPALEAQGLSLEIQDPVKSKELIADSRMQQLRNIFNEYLQTTSGPMHLAELASEVQRLVARLTQDIDARKTTEDTPREEVQNTIKGYKAQKSVLIKGKQPLKEALIDLGNSAIKRAFAGSDPDNLAQILAERLTSKINDGDVLSESVIHTIETEKASIVREWISKNTKALIPRWIKSWDSFISQSNEMTEDLLNKAQAAHDQIVRDEQDTEADIMLAKVEERVIRKVGEDKKEQTLKDTLDVMSTTWKTWTFVAGLGAAGIVSSSAAASPLLVALGPVGWGILATAGVGAMYRRWKLTQHRNTRRQEMLEDIPEYSQRVINSYQNQAEEFIKNRVGNLLEVIDNKIEQLGSSINSLEQRLMTGEYRNRARRIEDLSQILRQCLELNSHINDFYKTIASLNPNIGMLASN